MLIKFIQANVNTSRPSLDLLLHHARDTKTGILMISEPNSIPPTDNWYSSRDDKAAIFIDPNYARVNCNVARIGSRFVAVNYGPYLLISIYIPPSLDLRGFNNTLDELSEAISHRMSKVIIGGDFNAKASLWGAGFTDRRGLLLSRWAAERDFRIINQGDKPTYVRPQDSSIIDLTWSLPDLMRFIRNRKVEEETESLSDHLYVSFELHTTDPSVFSNRSLSRLWSCKRFNTDLFIANLIWRGYGPVVEDLGIVDNMVGWLDRVLAEACDLAANRIGPRKPRRTAYWWQDSAALIRRDCLKARRSWQKAKRKRKSLEVT